MRLSPTVIELSLERRDSMRISRSRQASCAACARARARLHGFAAFFAFAFERRAARIERIERHETAIELGAGARQRVLAEPDFARDFGGLFFEAFAAHRGFLRTRALAFELAEQVGVVAMRALDAALRLVAFAARPTRGCSRQAASAASISRVFSSLRASSTWSCLTRCSRSSTPECASPPRLTRSQSRPIHSPERVITDSSSASSRRMRSASASVSARRTRDSSRTMADGPLTTPDSMLVLPSASMWPPACSSDTRPTGRLGSTSATESSSSTHSASR